jgi:hypothetical protein
MSTIQNPDAAQDALDALVDDRVITRDQASDLDATRRHLEQPAAPAPDDDIPETVSESDAPTGYRMTEGRRVGSVAIPVEGHGRIRFGKPSGRASTELLAPVEEMDEDGDSLSALTAYVWPTLASWAIDDEHDVDWWADEVAVVDAIQALRQVALGGNAQTL